MEQNTPTRVHCFFEQSGTFKNEFIKLGIPAEDYDIQNHFGQTDHVIDLFAQIEAAYDGKASVFDTIKPSDLIMAFFPCIYFCEANTRMFRFEDSIHCKHTHARAVADMIERSRERQRFWELCIKLFCVADTRGLQLVCENPYSKIHFLVQYFPYRAAIIDWNRSLRGDKFVKPTQYFFINREPTKGLKSLQPRKPIPVNSLDDRTRAKRKSKIKLCSEKKSEITSDYARNFICDFILGKRQAFTDLELFND